MNRKISWYKLLVHLFFVLACACFLIPFIYVISLSFTSEETIQSSGYTLFPKSFNFIAYKIILQNPTQLIDSYKITIIVSLTGALCAMIVMSMIAYSISRSQFEYKKPVTFFVFFTMLFNGGLIPTYIVNTRYLHLTDSISVYILPGLATAYYILIIRTFFKSLPESLVESAKIDGAKEFTIFTKIILPLSKPVLATIALFTLLSKWNDWQTSLIYIRNEKLYTLQYLLQRILRESEFLQQMSQNTNLLIDVNSTQQFPLENMRFAMAILAAGPMMIVFPFFQKYFTKGLTIGAVKG